MIPLTEDVMKLQKVLKSTEEEAKDKLLNGPNPTAYETLSECLLAQIILFNRRRQGEAAKMPLVTYRDRAAEQPNEDIMKCLSRLEKDLSHEFTRLVVRGKRGRKVPVLLTKGMTSSLDFLIENRGVERDILESYEYVFARQNTDSHIRGSDCLRKYAALSGAKRPETLTSTQLRKHVATLSQIMNLKDNESDQLAKYMGHDIRVHREYYRLTENTLQLAKMSKLLMAIELGTDVYRGKSLDELDLDLEMALSAKDGSIQESQVTQSNDSGETLELPEDMDEPDRKPSEEKRGETGSSKRKRTKERSRPSPCSDEEPQSPSFSQPFKVQKRGETGSSKRKRTKERSLPSPCSDEEPQSPSFSQGERRDRVLQEKKDEGAFLAFMFR
ncbi:uncharacterized protein LOC115572198 isoform X3 [Sparus aurata]|uniref:uncharacterized protein LOC115572198 isoform X3 n=1 Tax=Sparus aurata TaxID=8175 RepID=UPI0011C1592C|nr:uncharacterized protein LOC115572198 isoform X3 [Sparus aurata]